ncbi:vacuolar calcium ion transporter [Ilyonectria robusta]
MDALPMPYEHADERSPLLSSDQSPRPSRQCLRSCMQMCKPGSYTNLLIVFAPLGITAGFLDKSPALVFNLNFLAIASLSKLNNRRLCRLSAVLGPGGGGLLYALFDNAPLLIVSLTRA